MKSRLRVRRFVVVTTAIVLTGCFDVQAPTSRRVNSSHAHLFSSRASPQFYSANDEFAAIANAESTFAGFYLAADQAPVVLLTDTTRLDAALSAGLSRSLSGRGISASAIRIRVAAYSFGALKRWYEVEGIEQEIGSVESSIDVVNNRLRFRVTSFTARENALRTIAGLGIPMQAVQIEVGPPVQLAGTVRDRIRPLMGGILTHLYKHNLSPTDTACTLGFLLKNANGTFFMSASHCSDSMYAFGTRPDSTWQNTMASSNYIGVKYQDPPFTSSCSPHSSPCRYSDAALWQRNTGDSSDVGSIARTTYSDSITLAANPFTISDSAGWSGGTYYSPGVGQTVWKTGEKTGMTGGTVLDNCVTVTPSGSPTLICIVKVNAHVDNGDSGGPVYQWDGSSSTVKLWGIVQGKRGSDTMFFSPMENINADFLVAGYGRVGRYLPPGPALSGGSITGPTLVGQTYCTWTGSASNGTPPFVYSWSVYGEGDENPLQVDTTTSGSDVFGYNNLFSSSFTVSLTVTDYYGDEVDPSLGVSGTGYSCGS